ncbi:MAG: ATP-binding protein, partial [Chitinivibrionales bacterium]|nr:ATP-binding protein [Chitinivibrionales bacterium]
MSNHVPGDSGHNEHALLQSLMDNIPDSIYFKDTAGRFLLVNRSEALLAGLQRTADAIGKTDFDFFPHELARQYRGDEEKIYRDGRPLVNKEEMLIDPSGAERWFSTTKIPLHGDNCVITGLMGISREITAHKQSEKEKERLRELQLQQHKMEAIGLLTSGIAHNFNNLMTPVQGYAELALQLMSDTEPHYDNVSRILLSAKRVTDLTRQLLLFSRKQAARAVTVDLNASVASLLATLRRSISGAVRVTADLCPYIWLTKGDPVELDQVIMNLIVNARDAMPKGGALSIRTRNVSIDELYRAVVPYARRGDFIRLSITDSGVGIHKDEMLRIFEPFYSTKDRCRGTGMGLSVAYGVVKRHRGWFNVYSEVGKGSTFNVFLPAFSAVSETKEHPVCKAKGAKILLVEDEDIVRSLVAKALRDSGCAAAETRNAEEARSVFKNENGNCDLVFCDAILPENGCLRLVGDVLAQKPDCKVLLTSGHADEKA